MNKETKEALTAKKKELSSEAMEKRKSINKKILKFGCLPILLLVIIIAIIPKGGSNDKPEKYTPPSKEWTDMTYEERQELLEYNIEKRKFSNASDLEFGLRDAIKLQVRNPKTISYEWAPSVYEGLANIVEADSGWIHLPFKLNAKNDFGIEKEMMGSAMLQYNPEDKSLSVREWNVDQNN